MNLRQWGKAVAGGAADLLFPPQCVWCTIPTAQHARFCPTCRLRFVSHYYRCQKCATPLPAVLPNADCLRCRAGQWKFSSVITLAPYRGHMRKAIIAMKRKGNEPLRQGMAQLLVEMLHSPTAPSLSLGDAAPLLIPVPYHWSHSLGSAADTAAVLARGIASGTGWPLAQRAVRRVRKTSKQGVLSWSQRMANVQQAFAVVQAPLVAGKHVLLVDDVLTSGATAAEISRLLLKAGAAAVSVIVAARATGVRESPSME